MSWWSRLFNHSRSHDLSRDIEREMRFHLDERADELMQSGMRPADARREARRRFGSVAMQAEHTRERDLFAWLDVLIRDLKYAVRSLRGAPAFTLVAVLSLGLGIGANTAIFSLINAVLLRSLPVSHPEQLVKIVRGGDNDTFTNPLWEAIRDRQDVFSSAFAFASKTLNLTAGGEIRRAQTHFVSGEYFSSLGVGAELGRTIVKADDVRGCPGIAVLSDAFWRSEYGADSNVLEKTIAFNGHPFRIVGVADPRFSGTQVGEHPQAYVPICSEQVLRGANNPLDKRSWWYLNLLARPKPGISTEQINARLSALAPGINEATLPPNWSNEATANYRKALLRVEPAATGFSDLRSTYKKTLYVLMVIVALVLAVACANVANLLLARAAARQREMAVRLALGAGRGRLARQLVTESLLLSSLGAVVGVIVAMWGSRVLVGLLSRSGGRGASLDLGIDGMVLGFTIAIAVVTGLLFGLVPAWRAGRVDPQTAMKAQGRGVAEGHSRISTAKTLVVVQVALSLVLVAGAGLLVESWRKLATLDPGFRRDGILIVSTNIHETGMPADQRLEYFGRMLERLRSLPGVESASMSALTPIGNSQWNDVLKVEGFTPKSEDDAVSWMNAVSDDYFSTFGIPVKQGRDFTKNDDKGATKVVIVSESMARHFFGTPSVIGKRFQVEEGKGYSDPLEIVGVVGDTKYRSLRDSAPSIVYYPEWQQGISSEDNVFQLRTSVGPQSAVPAVKAVIAEFSPRITLEITTLDRQLDDSTVLPRAIAMLSGFFGVLALLLAAIGLYGIMAYSVARRRNEIGVRIALGAEYSRVVRMVMGEVGRIVVAGVVIGVLLSTAATRLVKAFLYGLGPNDPTILTTSAAILLLVGLCAAALPAWRAARLDPVAALREE